jgi:hypothetical protein
MTTALCELCDQEFAVPSAAGAHGRHCPTCHDVNDESALTGRWFVAHDGKRYGPFSCERLLTMESRGHLDADDVLVLEGGERSLLASQFCALYRSTQDNLVSRPAAAARMPDIKAASASAYPSRGESQPQALKTFVVTDRSLVSKPGTSPAESAGPDTATTSAATIAELPQPHPGIAGGKETAPAHARLSFLQLPWIYEGVVAASVSLLIMTIVVAANYLIIWSAPAQQADEPAVTMSSPSTRTEPSQAAGEPVSTMEAARQ